MVQQILCPTCRGTWQIIINHQKEFVPKTKVILLVNAAFWPTA
jgi:hypothetical protein